MFWKKNKTELEVNKNLAKTFKRGKNSKIHAFMSRFAKAILTMIAVLPAAGLIITLGKLIGPLGLGQITAISKVAKQIGAVIETIGWVPFTHMGGMFAIAIAGSWSKDKAGGAFAGFLAYGVLLAVGSNFFIQRGEGNDREFLNYILGRWMPTKDFFSPQEGVLSIRFDALGGIIMGFVGASIYNKWHTFNKLPQALAFFNGPRFVPFMVFFVTLPIATGISLVWPLFQTGINWIGKQIATNQNIPFIFPFLYGMLERLFLPFGLHHMLTIPMNYSTLGGELDYLNPDQFTHTIQELGLEGKIHDQDLVNFFKWMDLPKTQIKAQGQEYMWYTWISGLGSVKNNWEVYVQTPEASALAKNLTTDQVYAIVMKTFAPVRFKVGQMISSSGSLIGAALGMMYAIPKQHRNNAKSIYISGALACLLTGVTEPVEFIFMFTAPILYLVHAILTGVAFGLSDFIPMRIHAFGGIETMIKWLAVAGPSSLVSAKAILGLKAILWLDGVWLWLVTFGFGGLYFVFFYYIVRKTKPAIPGFEENINGLEVKKIAEQATKIETEPSLKEIQEMNLNLKKDDFVVAQILELLGGIENLVDVDACMTRLRVHVRDSKKVQDQFKQKTGAIGVLVKGNSYQIVYGPKANIFKEIILSKKENW